jgi:hypothetical protein
MTKNLSCAEGLSIRMAFDLQVILSEAKQDAPGNFVVQSLSLTISPMPE